MKNKIKYLLQHLLGFNNYLYYFAKFKIATLKWDKNENDFFHFVSLLPNDGAILDIGSNIGIMSCTLAKLKPNAHIFSYEPIKENYEVLHKIVKSKTSNISLYNIALGSKKGLLTMIMPTIGKAKQQGLSHVYDENEKYDYDGEKYSVPVERVDDLFLNFNKNIVGIKIDVENFEHQVLLGAQELLVKHKPILYVELWDNQNRTDCFDLMGKLGYQTFVLEHQKLVKYNNQHTQNFFFLYNKAS